MTYLAETPSCVVQALLTMLPRLAAEESYQAAERVAVGSGSAGEGTGEITGRWATAADLASPEPVEPAKRPTRDPGELAGFIKVVRVPRGTQEAKG